MDVTILVFLFMMACSSSVQHRTSRTSIQSDRLHSLQLALQSFTVYLDRRQLEQHGDRKSGSE